MKAKREQAYGDLLIIKLFASNYARDLLLIKTKFDYAMQESHLSRPDTGFLFSYNLHS
jgi:hypothetical protein